MLPAVQLTTAVDCLCCSAVTIVKKFFDAFHQYFFKSLSYNISYIKFSLETIKAQHKLKIYDSIFNYATSR